MAALIVNADDFGRSPGVNAGVLEAHRLGIVTSTTVMVNFPDTAPAIEQALRDAPDLGMGLHLNLTAGRPLSDPSTISSLVDDRGIFQNRDALVLQGMDIDADVFRVELAAQMARFIELAGQPPTHLDAHVHITYLIPSALKAMFELAAQYDLPIRNPIPVNAVHDPAGVLRFHLAGLPPDLVDRLVAHLLALFESSTVPRSPAYFVPRFFSENAILGELLVILTSLPADGVTELMCHPRHLEGLHEGAYYAESELAALKHPSTHEVVAAQGIHLMTFAELLR